MKQNISFIFYIKIFMFILLIWMCHFCSDMNRFNEILDENYGSGKKLDKRIYRLLVKYKKDIFSNVGDLELKIPYNKKWKSEKSCTIDDEKWVKEKKEKLYRSLLYKEQLIKQLMKNKNTMFHKSYNHYEKKIMNGLDDKVFFNKMMLINDKDYKKLKRKKYGLRFCLLLLMFLLVSVIPIVDLSLGNFKTIGILINSLCQLSGYDESSLTGSAPENPLSAFWFSTCQLKNYIGFKIFSILTYCLPMLILGSLIVRGIYYYYKNIIKHKKIRFLETFNEW
ncbi:Plasmodium exported protein, unknown function [Plasmodium malariae]|uniref:Fam-l protein n=1 Tax=Plasmodium malariae TaxID=5858 RepID=A0A1D3JM28_PLAMA|nr:Plasmodium exported protein, unknown function [Plasmodium malariae]SBT87563.1 Plasmodium exported protein, unknown function [Plasmodium malariae]